MSKIMINVRAMQAVRNGLLRFDTETKNFEVLNENGEWVESNAGITNVDNAENVGNADIITSASAVTSASEVTSAGLVEHAENMHSHNSYTIDSGGTFVVLSQSEYDALENKDENTFYMIEDV